MANRWFYKWSEVKRIVQLKPAVQELCGKYDLLEKIECRQFRYKEWELLLGYVRIIEFIIKASKWLEDENILQRVLLSS